jgi:hypothetical protein
MRKTETYTAKVVRKNEQTVQNKTGGMRRDGFASCGGGRKKLCRFGRAVQLNQLVYQRVGWDK